MSAQVRHKVRKEKAFRINPPSPPKPPAVTFFFFLANGCVAISNETTLAGLVGLLKPPQTE